MKSKWFECTVKYMYATTKEVVETYLVDALSFTEAENKMIEFIAPFSAGSLEVEEVKKRRIAELFKDENGDKWFKCKVHYITIDEKSGVEKKTASIVMVQADSLQNAVKNLEFVMKDTLSDWEIAAISLSPVIDVIWYEPCENEQSKKNETEE